MIFPFWMIPKERPAICCSFICFQTNTSMLSSWATEESGNKNKVSKRILVDFIVRKISI